LNTPPSASVYKNHHLTIPARRYGRGKICIYLTQFISHRLAGENLKGSTVTARECLMGANLFDAGSL
jgi:hypothetical protein